MFVKTYFGSVLLCICLLLSTNTQAMGASYGKPSVNDINANPSILNGLHLKNSDLDGLDLKNAVIKNLTFEDIKALDAKFTNITFENCQFIKVNFIRSTFSNVAFKNCKFLSLDNTFHHTKTTRFGKAVLNNVLFEGTELVYVDFGGIRGNGGFVLFKNITKAMPRGEAPLIDISDAQVRVDNSVIHGVIAGNENVDSITKNSKYIEGGIYCDHNFVMNSSTERGDQIGSSKTLVIKDSIMNGNAIIGGNGYLVNNTYVPGTLELWGGRTKISGFGIHAEENDRVYVLAKNNAPTAFRIFGGNITLKNFILVDTSIGSLLKSTPDIFSLNLQNVTIIGGEWEGKIRGGKWENVRIEPVITTEDNFVQNIQAYRLELPKGNPWKREGEFKFEIKESNTPFDWPEIKVPTPEDLGLVWWPEVEPGYRP